MLNQILEKVKFKELELKRRSDKLV